MVLCKGCAEGCAGEGGGAGDCRELQGATRDCMHGVHGAGGIRGMFRCVDDAMCSKVIVRAISLFTYVHVHVWCKSAH